MPFRDQLNPQQREAVETTDGPLLILAGAGSGKTRVITYRIAHLVENCGVAADAVLAVTFTNKAAAEMAQRVDKMVGHRSFTKPRISTFHSFCVRVLRRDIEKLSAVPNAAATGAPGREAAPGLTRSFVIYDESDQQQVVKAALKRLGVDDKSVKPSAVLSHISWAKNHMLDPQEFYLQSADPKAQQVAHVYAIYKRELVRANALDFDDLLLEAVRLLRLPEVRDYYTRKYQYLLVDEYQDTNRPQYELMRLLAGDRHNVCAVGDEDQSIYSWRGADIRNILEFERDFPNAHIIRLEQNYRSTQNILQAASAVVANNVKRKGKNLWTSRQGGVKIGYYEAPDGENEALFAADYISKFLARATEDGQPARAAVLYRTNSQSRLFEEAMRRYRLKYHVVGGFSFYERAEIKDMISYLKAVHNPHDTIALLRVVNTPARGIGKASMEVVERVGLETGKSLWSAMGEVVDRQLLPARALAALKGFREIIDDARAMLAGTYADRLSETLAAPKPPEPKLVAPSDDDISFEFGGDDMSFDFAAETGQPETDPPYRSKIGSDKGGPPKNAGSDDGGPPDETGGAEGRPPTPGGDATEAPPENAASLGELLKVLIDRTRYIKLLEEEDTPESLDRVDNLKELVNAAMDAHDRGESLGEFLDHAALVSDADQYDESSQITLMTLHAAKGLEFPLVFLVGLEEGLFPHSRTFNSPDELEEERRLCYVGMTRAMDALMISRARYRRRYGTETPEASIPSRFLEEIPAHLMEDLGSPRRATTANTYTDADTRHYAYEDEDQRPAPQASRSTAYAGRTYNSIDNIAEFFASRGKKFVRPKMEIEEQAGQVGFRKGDRVRHPKYGEGTVFLREGSGDATKLSVHFPRHGLKKLVEKFAQLEKA